MLTFDVMEPVDGNTRRVWSFSLIDDVARLLSFSEQVRASSRHRWRNVTVWSQYKGERLDGRWLPQRPETPAAIREAALRKIRDLIRFQEKGDR